MVQPSVPHAIRSQRGPSLGSYRDPFPGIRWVRLPLPFELNHINVWLLDDGDGWTLVDTGLDNAAVRDTWESLFSTALEGRPIRRIIVTHYHPDHMGLARFLWERFRPQLLMSADTAGRTRCLLQEAAAGELEHIAAFCRAHGIGDVGRYTAFVTGEGYRRMVSGLPEAVTVIDEDSMLCIGGRDWRPLIANGHAPGHTSLYCAEADLLISGDQILPTISPNISVHANNHDEDALHAYLTSLQRCARLGGETVVLPSHGRIFTGLHARIDGITTHHRERLDSARSLCVQPLCLAEVTPQLFRRRLQGNDYPLALGEALSHLIYLANRNDLDVVEEGGVQRFVMP